MTMEHPSDGRLLAYLDGELPPAVRERVSEHIGRCGACAAEVEELTRIVSHVSDGLSALDRPAPDTAYADVVRRASSSQTASGLRWRRMARTAAAVVVLLGGVAAAVPGSPLRAWIERSVDEVARLFRAEEPSPSGQAAEEGTAAGEADDLTGVAVALSDGRIRVDVHRLAPETVVRVRTVEEPHAAVWGGSQYRTSSGRVEVMDATGKELRVDLPRSADRALVTVEGVEVARLEGGRLVPLTSPVDSSESSYTFRGGG